MSCTMWTVIESPIGPLRLVEQDGAITAIEFSPFRDQDGGVVAARPARPAVMVAERRELDLGDLAVALHDAQVADGAVHHGPHVSAPRCWS